MKGYCTALAIVVVFAVTLMVQSPQAFAGGPCKGKEITVIVKNGMGDEMKKVPSRQAHYATYRRVAGKCGATASEPAYGEANMSFNGLGGGGKLPKETEATGTLCIEDSEATIDTIHSQWEKGDGTKIYCETKQINACAKASPNYRCEINPGSIATNNTVPINAQ